MNENKDDPLTENVVSVPAWLADLMKSSGQWNDWVAGLDRHFAGAPYRIEIVEAKGE